MEKFLFINFIFEISSEVFVIGFQTTFSSVQYVTVFIEIIKFPAYSCVQDIFQNFYSKHNFKP